MTLGVIGSTCGQRPESLRRACLQSVGALSPHEYPFVGFVSGMCNTLRLNPTFHNPLNYTPEGADFHTGFVLLQLN